MRTMRIIPALCFLMLTSWVQAARQAAIVVDESLPPPARHGLARLQEMLRTKGLSVKVLASPIGASTDFVVLMGLSSAKGAAASALKELSVPLPRGQEALVVRRAEVGGKPGLVLCASDARGLMYAALDAADRISWSDDANHLFAHIRDTSEKPYVSERAVSIYTMQRAYFESRLYDETYWQRYFDMLAENRINSFVVIFGYENGGFMAPPYPYFFDVGQFPEVKLTGITPAQQERNVAAFRKMIRTAHERGISFVAAIWDHIYRGGVQGGGIPGASEKAGKPTPGLVWGLTADNLAPYTKAALRKFLEVFPEVDGLQFRMHGESGLKQSEMEGFWHDVFGMIRQLRPAMHIDIRAKGLPDSIIDDGLTQGLNLRVATKYWMEQMGLPFPPTHINRQNQHDRRHGYADLLRYPQRYKVHWRLWNGGTTRLLLWGDPDYVRRFAASTHIYDGDSFEINEMLATKMLGEPHGAKPIEILNPRYRYYDYEFERYWHFYQVWGRLSYNPETPPEIWGREFDRRFGHDAGMHLSSGLHLASKVLPRIVAASYRYQLFPTTRGWAEMMREGDLPEYAQEQGSDIQQFMNVHDQARSMVAGTDTAMRRPAETSRWFADISRRILDHVAQAEKTVGDRRGNEFISTITDLKILAWLAKYHSERLQAGVYYNLYKDTRDLSAFDVAIRYERQAIQAWEQLVSAAGDVYSDNLAFGVHRVGFSRHWREELQSLRRGLEQLQRERQQAKPAEGASPRIPDAPAADRQPPDARIERIQTAKPGQNLKVTAKVSDMSGVKWVRLRYRHVTQFEDYLTLEMTLDPTTDLYQAEIPGSFLIPKWDLMYFVETMDNNGNGRMYPDLEQEMPYVIVKLER
jgi:hypothetical protein